VSGHRVAAITRRLLQGFRRDRRTLALLFVAPIVILGLLGYLMRGSTSAPSVGIANEDSGPVGALVAAALRASSHITTTDINAADGDARLKDGSLAAYIVLPSDFSQQAQSGNVSPEVHLEGSQPGVDAPVLQALQQAMITLASLVSGRNVNFQPQIHYLYGGANYDTLD
jgi:ABC-2 type transport system permease protein